MVMNQINPRKLHGSKWTAMEPQDKEKHFMVVQVLKEEEVITSCVLEAVYSKRQIIIPWRALKDASHWRMGWH